MESSSDPQLAKSSTSTFATPSTSAGTLTHKLSLVTLDTVSAPISTKRGTKRPKSPSSSDNLMPATKKNRDYLPNESKVVYFDLKKQFKHKSKWAAHQLFMNNCAESGNFPRPIQYKCSPPWQFNNQELTHKWAKTQQQAPAELCKLISLDCKDRLINCQAAIDTLLTDLQKLIPDTDFREIKGELQHDLNLATDRLYAEKILARNNANKPRSNAASTSTAKKSNPRASGKPKPKGRQPRGRSRPRPRRGDKQPNNPADVRSRPGAVKQDLMRQLNDLTKAIKKMNQ